MLLFPICDCRLPIEEPGDAAFLFQLAIANRHSAIPWMAGRPRLLHIKKQLGRFLWSQAIPTWAML
jgi:hypothetical protein